MTEMTSRSDSADRKVRRKGGHLCPPNRMCDFCYRAVPPAETVEACTGCLGEWKRMQAIRNQVNTVFNAAQSLSLSAVFKVLWDFKWKHKNL